MKTFLLASALMLGISGFAVAQEAPKFFSETYPSHGLQSALEARSALQSEEAVLDAKTRELISLAVAAQIPCSYCSYAHTERARAEGATDEEIREAVAAAAQVRHWSTVLNGMQYDLEAFKSEFDEMFGTTE
ncbi:carboxymuconolactone decarboxylase family protein [Halomonas sp. ATCH28]|uniref:Carboxymuconolactone decarboxylase family protein n=1 Tax=Halomonas gemina TaxID=2945105 RepID=A0ABT0T5R3_9GAMM|nr:carboxymuconolactone decarboxylase family protein [Halomonas gemina]MCL7942271.1 carboxymuconolactone decarboxylase family protein [Halomonas gemina]